jgi:nicotinamidase-related amidase
MEYNTDILFLIPKINIIKKKFDTVIFAVQIHSPDHQSFNNSNPHCINGTIGAKLDNGLIVDHTDFIVSRGMLNLYDSDSVFYISQINKKESNLSKILSINQIDHIYICGLEAEKSIFSTSLDCIKFGYKCTIIEDMSFGIDPDNVKNGFDYLKKIGVNFLDYKFI